MEVKHLEINNQQIWLLIDQLMVFVEANNNLEYRQKYVCYFKYSEPNILFFGELFKGEDDLPILFNTIDDATNYAMTKFEEEQQ